jgi:multiple antibiotic resistance protein
MTLPPLLNFALFAFVSLFTMVNPVGVIPVYTGMTANLSAAESRRVAFKATLTATLILLGFALTGQWLFRFFGISTDSLRIVGGIIFFLMGYEMLQARLTRTKYDDETVHEYMSDISLTPLAIPIIAGPGAITSAIILMNQAKTLPEAGVVLGVIVTLMGFTHLLLLGAKQVTRILGENGNKVMLRLMGLIVMVIAVEFFFSGLRPILRGILQLN